MRRRKLAWHHVRPVRHPQQHLYDAKTLRYLLDCDEAARRYAPPPTFGSLGPFAVVGAPTSPVVFQIDHEKLARLIVDNLRHRKER